ncbi:MAG: hypothetical protein IKO99_09635 [Bacteroidales bacterium]|nr:hypothetical protein [Bacteroidales bacterium]
MFLTFFSQDIKVFLAECTSDVTESRQELKSVLLRAGIEVVEPLDGNIEEALSSCDCAVYVLGTLNFYSPDGAGYDTPAGVQYRQGRQVKKDGFKIFLWNPTGLINTRNFYINSIRRDIVENTIYSSTTSPIVFTEDLRTIMNVRTAAVSDLSSADVYFIYNDLDTESAKEILSMLSDIVSVKPLCINMNSDIEYNEKISSELPVCKIGVVYYDYASDWALSFSRQVWKDNGGQGGKTPLLVAANQSHADAEALKKVLKGIMEFSVNDKTLIPLDIKIFFDKAAEK